MEPPTKRPRLLQYLGRDGDDELVALEEEDLAPERQLEISRDRAAMSLKSRMELIFEKYGRDFTDVTDEIDLQTGEVIVDNGHLDSIFGSKSRQMPADADEDDSDVTDLNGGGSDDEEEEEEEDEGGSGEEDECVVEEQQGAGSEEEMAQRGVPAAAVPVDPDEARRPLEITNTAPNMPGASMPQPPFLGLAPVAAWAGAPQSLISKINELLSAATGGSQALQQPTAPLDLLSMTNHTVESAWRVPALPTGPVAPVQPSPGGRVGSIRKRSTVPLKSLMRKVMAEADSEDEIQASAKEPRENAAASLSQVSQPACEPRDTLADQTPKPAEPQIEPLSAPQPQPEGASSSSAEKQQAASLSTPPDTSSSEAGTQPRSYPALRSASRATRSRKRRASGPASSGSSTPITSSAQQEAYDAPQPVDEGLCKTSGSAKAAGESLADTAAPAQLHRVGGDIVIYIVDEGLRQLKLQASAAREGESHRGEDKEATPLGPRRRLRGRPRKTARDEAGTQPTEVKDTAQPMKGLAPSMSTEAGSDTVSVGTAAQAEPAQSVPQPSATPPIHQDEGTRGELDKAADNGSSPNSIKSPHASYNDGENGWMARRSHAGRSRGHQPRTSSRPRALREVSGNRSAATSSSLRLDVASAMTAKQASAGLPSPAETSDEPPSSDEVPASEENPPPADTEPAENLPREEEQHIDDDQEGEALDQDPPVITQSDAEEAPSQCSPVDLWSKAKCRRPLGFGRRSEAGSTAPDSLNSDFGLAGSSKLLAILVNSESDEAEGAEEAIRAAAGPRRGSARRARRRVRADAENSCREASPDHHCSRDGADARLSSQAEEAAYDMLETEAEAAAVAATVAASSPPIPAAMQHGPAGSLTSEMMGIARDGAAAADTPSRRPRSRHRHSYQQQQHRSTSPLISLIYDSDEDELSSIYFSSPGGSVRGVVSNNNSDGTADGTAVRSAASLFNISTTTTKFPWSSSSSSTATPSSFLQSHRRRSFAAAGARTSGCGGAGGNTSPTNKNLRRRLFMTKASSSSAASASPGTRAVASLGGGKPRHHRLTPAGGGGSSSSRSRASAGSVILTPGGSKRRCGQDGFRCDRDFCFFCLAE